MRSLINHGARVPLLLGTLLLFFSGTSAPSALAQSATGSIAASPNPCMIPSGQTACTTAVTWSTQNVTSASVTVEDKAGGGEVSFASGLSGSQSASIQAPPHQYTFRLYDTSSGTPVFLAATTVVATGSGTLEGSPNPCAIPSGGTTCSSTVSWSTQNVTTATVTVQDAAGGGETAFSTGASGSQAASIQAPPHKYTFRLYDTSSGTAYLIAVTVVQAEGSGTFSASPNPCAIPQGSTTCSTTISWTTQNVTSGQVTVQDLAGGGEAAFATGASGSQLASLQAPPHLYVFRLYDTSSGTAFFITSITVVATGTGTLSATPNPCLVLGGGTSCDSTVSWNTSNVTSAKLTVQDAAGGGEVLVASTTSGSQSATIQLPPHQYTFRLYDTSSGTGYLIAALTVLAEAETLTATPNPCPVTSVGGTCTSTISWSTQNLAAAEVTVQDATGGGEVSFASSLSGSKDATIQLLPHKYTFRLYDTSSGSRILITATVVVAEGTGTIAASPDPCPVANGQTSCTTTISWATQNVTAAQVTVEDKAGGGEVAFASALSGSQSATVQLLPHEYIYRLYDSSSGTPFLIAAATVVAGASITASPDPCAIPGGSTSCSSTVNWNVINSVSAQVTVQDAAGGGEVLFATGPSGSQAATIQLLPHKYTFRVYDTSSGSPFFVASTIVLATGTGTISASPDPCSIQSGSTTCASTVTWSTQNVAAASVTVEDAAGGGEVSFASGISGSQSASIQASPHKYTFRLYDISSGTRYFLASWAVIAIGSGTISASPNPCTILSGQTSCSSTVSWSTANATTAKVTVEDTSVGGETAFATGLSGSKSATIQGSPHQYVFRLYDTTWGATSSFELTAVTVTGGSAPAAPSNLTATAGSITSGTGKNATVTDFVNLAWQDNSNNENNFIIQRCQVVTKGKLTSCGFSVIATVGANVTAFKDNNVARQKTYKYFIQAQNSFGISGASNVVTVTTP